MPIALGLVAIFGQSAYEIFSGRGEGYCDSLTGLIFFLLCGRLFQQKTHDRLAFVTGESEPATRRAGEHLYAGGRQIGGAIEVETIKPVCQSYLTSLWNNEAFRKDQNDDLNTLTNRYSRRFTLLVIGIAVIAAVFWAFSDAGRAMKAFASGETNIFGDASTDHFVGWKTTDSSWARDTNWNIYTNGGAFTIQPFKRIGTTNTTGSGTQTFYGLP